MTFDLVLANGTVIDGTGRDGTLGSVGIRDGRIAAYRFNVSRDIVLIKDFR